MIRLDRFAMLVLLAASTVAAIPAVAQSDKATLEGSVKDASAGVIVGAKIRIANAATHQVQEQTTDQTGEYQFQGLPPGSYSIEISAQGFQTSSIPEVKLQPGEARQLDVQLRLGEVSQTVEVTAPGSEASETQIQRTSEDIVNVISADVITSLPNANIADAVGRLPGVTLERDEGEGKYVQVRGTEPRLTNVTIDGINVPSPEVAVRQIKLDVIPADLVESVVLEKTLSASQDGDAIGGTVDMRLKNALDQPTLTIDGMGGYTPILGGRYVGQTGATIGQRFGASKRFGALFGFTYDYNGRGIDDIEPGVDPGYAVPTYDSIDLREYRYQRKRWGFAGGTDYRFSRDSDVYLHYFYSDFKDYGNKWVYTLSDNVCEPGTCGGGPIITPGSPQFTTSQRTPDYSIASVSGGGRHSFGNSWFAWDFSASNGRQLQAAGNPGVTFTYSGSATCYYDPALNKTPFRPQWNPACTAPGSPIFNPNLYDISEFDTSTGPTDQVSLRLPQHSARTTGGARTMARFSLAPRFATRTTTKTQSLPCGTPSAPIR